MGLTKEEQRQKIRERGEQTKPIPKSTLVPTLIGDKVVFVTKRRKKRLNKKHHKPPKIFYGHNTNK